MLFTLHTHSAYPFTSDECGGGAEPRNICLPLSPSPLALQMVESELLLKSMLDEGPQGLSHRIFDKAGVEVTKLISDLDSFM